MCSSSLSDSKTRDAVVLRRRGFSKTESSLPLAGYLLIGAGLLALAQAWLVIQSNETDVPLRIVYGDAADFYFGVLGVLLGAIIVYGGVQTIRRANLSLSVIAAVLAIMSYISAVLGIMVLIIVHQSRGDFKNKLPPHEQILRALARMKNQSRSRHLGTWFPGFLSSLINHDVLAFFAVAVIGIYHLTLGIWDLGLFLLGLSGLLVIAASLRLFGPWTESASWSKPPGFKRRAHHLDLLAGRGLTLACGVLSLAAGVFFIANGRAPDYYYDIELSLQMNWWGGLSLFLGSIAFVGYALQFARRYFAYSLICTVVAAFSAFWGVGVPGGIIGVGAAFFAAISRDDFPD